MTLKAISLPSSGGVCRVAVKNEQTGREIIENFSNPYEAKSFCESIKSNPNLDNSVFGAADRKNLVGRDLTKNETLTGKLDKQIPSNADAATIRNAGKPDDKTIKTVNKNDDSIFGSANKTVSLQYPEKAQSKPDDYINYFA